VAGHSDREGDALKRLRRIEGRVRGVWRVVEEGTCRIAVLTRVSATTRAPRTLGEPMDTCVRIATADGGDSNDIKPEEAGDTPSPASYAGGCRPPRCPSMPPSGTPRTWRPCIAMHSYTLT
jgi:DNA-binding FrmR family transcriptional regulator